MLTACRTPWAVPAQGLTLGSRARCRHAREGAFPDELTLELGQGPEDVEDQPATWPAGVDRLGEAHERHPTSLQVPDDLDEVLEGPSEAVESPNHDGVPRSSLGEQVVQRRAGLELAAGPVDEDPIDPSSVQPDREEVQQAARQVPGPKRSTQFTRWLVELLVSQIKFVQPAVPVPTPPPRQTSQLHPPPATRRRHRLDHPRWLASHPTTHHLLTHPRPPHPHDLRAERHRPSAHRHAHGGTSATTPALPPDMQADRPSQ